MTDPADNGSLLADDDLRRRAVDTERAKLSATFFNTLASGAILAGVVIPAASALAGTTPAGAAIAPVRLLLSAGVWFFAGAALHYFARRLLRNINP